MALEFPCGYGPLLRTCLKMQSVRELSGKALAAGLEFQAYLHRNPRLAPFDSHFQTRSELDGKNVAIFGPFFEKWLTKNMNCNTFIANASIWEIRRRGRKQHGRPIIGQRFLASRRYETEQRGVRLC